MSTQNAIVLQAVGQPVVKVSNFPIPQPGPRQLQVRVTIAGLNPHDQKGRDIGLFVKDNLPAVLGSDVVGVVTTLGNNATRFKVGDKVFGQASLAAGTTQKALQEYAILDEDFAAAVPEGISDHETATLPTNVLAALVGLFDVEQGLGLPAPWSEKASSASFSESSILVVGGGTNCGRFATQLAKLVGFGTIVAVGGNEAELKRFGATHVVDRHGGHDAVLKRVRDVVGDELVYAIDAFNAPAGQHLAVNALSSSQKGKLARLVWSRGEVDESQVHDKKAGYELKNVMGLSHSRQDVAVPFWKNVGKYLVEGKVRPLGYVVEQGLDAEKVNEVFDRYRDGKPVTQTHFRASQ